MTDNNTIIKMDMGTMQSNTHAAGKPVLCLGIESSCDETSAAIVDSNRNVLAHIVYSQIPEHQKQLGQENKLGPLI